MFDGAPVAAPGGARRDGRADDHDRRGLRGVAHDRLAHRLARGAARRRPRPGAHAHLQRAHAGRDRAGGSARGARRARGLAARRASRSGSAGATPCSTSSPATRSCAPTAAGRCWSTPPRWASIPADASERLLEHGRRRHADARLGRRTSPRATCGSCSRTSRSPASPRWASASAPPSVRRDSANVNCGWVGRVRESAWPVGPRAGGGQAGITCLSVRASSPESTFVR